MSKILVVDDDPSILSAFEQLLVEQGYQVSKALHGQEALHLLATDRPDLIVMDIRMPGMSGLETLQRMRQIDRRLPVIIITGYGTMETAVQATKFGAVDYHLKPLDPEEVLRSIASALESVRLMDRRIELDGESPLEEGDLIVGRSRAMREVYKAIGRVAETDATVLIRGETGTGKELVARAIYQHSQRAAAPLVMVNCVAVPDTLLESEFFGHEKGSFTGAEKRKIGKFEQANGGTIFLDEIGDMPLNTQAKLLRVLQDRSVERVGGTERIQVDVRILAATNRDLEAAIRQGLFREDLYHRLGVFTIHLPPLRDRREDIPRLAAYFADRLARDMQVDKPVLTEEAVRELSTRAWPGNVRELQNCIHQAMILTRGYPIRAEHITKALYVLAHGAVEEQQTPGELPDLKLLVQSYLQTYRGGTAHTDFLEAAERLLLAEAMRLHQGNQTRAARLLGLPRPTLKSKLDRYGLGTDA
jgi:DNA-binding NtrC family response regulator